MKTLGDIPESSRERVLREEVLSFFRRRFNHDKGVLGVELGVRRVGGTAADPLQLALKVFVTFKGRPPGEKLLPRHVHRKTKEFGTVKVPLDIEQAPAVEPQFRHTPAEELRASEVGSTGFTVRGLHGQSYLVTAAHVLSGSPFDESAEWGKGSTRGSGVADPKWTWPWFTDPDTGGTGLIDSGVIRVQTPGLLTDSARVPWGTSVSQYDDDWGGRKVRICGKHGVTRAKFDSRIPTGMHVPVGHRSVRYARLLRFEFVGLASEGGDSGAPVIDEHGTLVGIHVALYTPQPEFGGPSFSLTVPAEDILAAFEGLLGPDPQLIPSSAED